MLFLVLHVLLIWQFGVVLSVHSVVCLTCQHKYLRILVDLMPVHYIHCSCSFAQLWTLWPHSLVWITSSIVLVDRRGNRPIGLWLSHLCYGGHQVSCRRDKRVQETDFKPCGYVSMIGVYLLDPAPTLEIFWKNYGILLLLNVFVYPQCWLLQNRPAKRFLMKSPSLALACRQLP